MVGAGLLIPARIAAQQAGTLEVSVDRSTVRVGDRIAVSISARVPADVQTNIDELVGQFGAIDVLVVGLAEEEPRGSEKIVRVRHEVALFRPGAAQIPALTLTSTGADGAETSLASSPIDITVQSVLPPDADPGDVRPLKPQIELPYQPGSAARTIIVIGAGVVALLLAGVFVLFWYLRRRARPAPIPVLLVAAEAPSAEKARAELERIGSLGLLEQDDLKTFHALIAACIRTYLSERFGFAAFAMTTTELAARMEAQGIDRWPARLVAGLLGECDAVNYARYTPARVRAETNLEMAFEIVELTREGADPVPAVR